MLDAAGVALMFVHGILLALQVASVTAEMDRLLPGEDAFRVELARVIVAATSDDRERLILTRVARYESNLRRDVAECRVLGPQGEVGPWQALARSPREREQVCGSLEGAARVALQRIRESEVACRASSPLDRGALYTRGRCDSAEGKRLSRHRWAP